MPVGLVRKLVQAVFVAYSVFIGFRFYRFYLLALGRSENFVPRPASIEVFLPISAMLELKNFLMATGSTRYTPQVW